MKHLFLACVTLLAHIIVFAQDRPQNGVAKSFVSNYILKNANIIVSPTKTIQNGYIFIEDGKIKDVGAVLLKAYNGLEVDCKGKTIIPAFIELNTDLGLKSKNAASDKNVSAVPNEFYAWNHAIKAHYSAASNYTKQDADTDLLIKSGFGYALTHQMDGIVRGSGALIQLGSHPQNSPLIEAEASSHFSLDKGSSKQPYPSSQMGAIALLKQTLHDEKWYSKNKVSTSGNLSLDALEKLLKLPLFFSTTEAVEILRGAKIAAEFNLNFIYIGSGNEYQFITQLKKLGSTMVIPAQFPEAYNVSDPYINMEIPLRDLKHWELAPSNPYLLAKNGIPFCLSFAKNKGEKEFWNNVRKAIERGLSATDALAALTTVPSKILGQEKMIGSLEVGKWASFSIYSDNPFEREAELMETWTMGQQKIWNTSAIEGITGSYRILVEQRTYNIDINKKGNSYEGKWMNAPKKELESVNVQIDQNDILIQIKDSINGALGVILLHGKINAKVGVFEGEGTDLNGKWIKWNAIKHKKLDVEKKTKSVVVDSLYDKKIWYPNMAFGFDSLPKQKNYIITNVTAWTNESDGIIKNATVAIENGKIAFVGQGKGPNLANAMIIDGTGMHLTTGIIDEHSHIAISKGVNEGGQSVTSEVSIQDVVRNNDINIYRQLAGGVTTSQLLHGSANAIGGQSAIIKLKWGFSPDEMLLPNAPKFIKFALGENVKQSNWSMDNYTRFPQTRMGVEQVFIDAFSRAKQYDEQKAKGKKESHRVDIELEVLSEILRKERFITCHSYVQSEINMLMKVADSFGFNVNTFTHILEGYKVADKMKKHGVGASTFGDWWAYKMEVMDAIPHNASLMHEQGLVVAINSDDAEMGRRLNQEAAKAMKYGGMQEEDAWKMVTLNPAKLLHLDDRLGSIKVGKDADLVLWTSNPLTVYAIPETVFIDGILLFDRKEDLVRQQRNASEKARIIAKMMEQGGAKSERKNFQPTEPKFFHCDTLGEEGTCDHNGH